MTTPSRSSAADADASASAARSASGRARPDAEHQQQLLLALTTEHFTLQTARAATIADSNGRAALYLSTMSGAVIALAFIGQVADVGRPFFLFAFALLPALVLLGILTYLRLLQTAVEDLFYARAINRIRGHYVHLDPDANRWFLLTSHDDPSAVMVNMGQAAPAAKHSRWHLLGHLLSHTATMAAVVTSIIGGVFAALAVGALGAGALSVTAAAGVGVAVTVAAVTAFGWHQTRRWRAAEGSVPSLFPSAPGPIAPLSRGRGHGGSYRDHPEDLSD
jgi:MFS family permease